MNQRPEPSNFAAEASAPVPERADGLTPAGLQGRALLTRRRLTVLALNVATFIALMWGLSIVLAAGGWTVIDVVIFVAFAFGAPWTVLGFWNAVIGLWLLHGVKDGVERVAPFAAAGHSNDPVPLTAVPATAKAEAVKH